MKPQYLGNKELIYRKLTAFFASRTVQTDDFHIFHLKNTLNTKKSNKLVSNKLILYLCRQKQVRAEQQLSLFRPKYFNQVYSFRLINHHSL